MARQATLKERLHYRLDTFMSRGSSSSFMALTVVFLGAFVLIAITRVVTTWWLGDPTIERGDSAWRQVWISFMEITDPGSMTQDIESEPVIKIFAVIAGMVGLVLLSALIAVITTALDQRLSALRKGHSRVVLADHTVILGWNERVVDILRELILANESEDDAAVVILADRDKEEMDDFLALHIPERMTTSIVTRSGIVSSLVNLEVAAVEAARSVLVLASSPPGADETERRNSDMQVIKTLLGVKQTLRGREDVPVVVEVFDARRRELAVEVDPSHVVSIDADEILAKILVQTSRSDGLAVVYEELLSFDGAEIYLVESEFEEPFHELTFRLVDGVALGVMRVDGELLLNPDADVVVQPGDELVVLASDDSAIAFGAPTTGREYPISGLVREQRIERELIVGWTNKLDTLVREYGDYVEAGSQIDIVLRGDEADQSRLDALAAEAPNLSLRLLEADPQDASELLELEPFLYDNIIILSEAGNVGAGETADAETMVFLLQLQSIFNHVDSERETKLIAEILDSRNRELVTEAGVRDFVISNRLVSMIMSQISEQREMSEIYDALFSEEGAELYLKEPELYFMTPMPERVSFADLMMAGQKRGEVTIGVRRKAGAADADANFGVTLIPPKDEVFVLDDLLALVVLAEDEV